MAKIDEIRNIINNVKDLKDRGKEGEDEMNLLDDIPGPKTGIKIYFNNLFNIGTGNPLKIEFSAYVDKEKIFDEFGNPGDYLLPLIDGHVDYESLVVQKKKSRRLKKRVDVEVDEVWYVVKDFQGLLEFFKH